MSRFLKILLRLLLKESHFTLQNWPQVYNTRQVMFFLLTKFSLIRIGIFDANTTFSTRVDVRGNFPPRWHHKSTTLTFQRRCPTPKISVSDSFHFFFLCLAVEMTSKIILLGVRKHIKLYSRLVMPSSGWYSPIAQRHFSGKQSLFWIHSSVRHDSFTNLTINSSPNLLANIIYICEQIWRRLDVLIWEWVMANRRTNPK